MGSIHQCIPFPADQFCGTNLYTYTVEDIYWLSCWFRRVIWMKHHKTCQFWCSAERAPFWLHDTTTNWTNKAISLRRAADRWCFYRYCGIWIVMTIVMSSSHGQFDSPDDKFWAVRVKWGTCHCGYNLGCALSTVEVIILHLLRRHGFRIEQDCALLLLFSHPILSS